MKSVLIIEDPKKCTLCRNRLGPFHNLYVKLESPLEIRIFKVCFDCSRPIAAFLSRTPLSAAEVEIYRIMAE